MGEARYPARWRGGEGGLQHGLGGRVSGSRPGSAEWGWVCQRHSTAVRTAGREASRLPCETPRALGTAVPAPGTQAPSVLLLCRPRAALSPPPRLHGGPWQGKGGGRRIPLRAQGKQVDGPAAQIPAARSGSGDHTPPRRALGEVAFILSCRVYPAKQNGGCWGGGAAGSLHHSWPVAALSLAPRGA